MCDISTDSSQLHPAPVTQNTKAGWEREAEKSACALNVVGKNENGEEREGSSHSNSSCCSSLRLHQMQPPVDAHRITMAVMGPRGGSARLTQASGSKVEEIGEHLTQY